MGLGSLLHDITNGVTLGGMDMSILSSVSLPDPEAQLKYDAMGLPDPVAFAALTALGAIPKPMAMLNEMMLKAEKRIEEEAAAHGLPPIPPADIGAPAPDAAHLKLPGMAEGKSFVEAFKDMEKAELAGRSKVTEQALRPDMPPLFPSSTSGYLAAAQQLLGQQEEHLAKQTKEATEQAKAAADRAREIASVALSFSSLQGSGATTDVKGVARAFSIVPDAAVKPVAQTLSALLGSQQPATGSSPGISSMDKICISKLPPGVTDGMLRLECARHGAVTSVLLQGDGSAAYITYATADMATNAMRRIMARPGALGSTAPLDVRLVSAVPENVRHAPLPLAPDPLQKTLDPSALPAYLRPKEDRRKEKEKEKEKRSRSRSRSRRKKKSQSRGKKRKKSRKRSRDRWLDRSRSHSHTRTGQYIRATGCTSSVRPWEKKAKRSSSSSRSRPRQDKEQVVDDKRPRQVAVKGCWAHFMFKGSSYYYNITTGHTQWDRPKDFDTASSRRAFQEAPANASLLQLSKSATGCSL